MSPRGAVAVVAAPVVASASSAPSWSVNSSAGKGGVSATSGCNLRAKADSAAPKPLLPSMRRVAWAAGSGNQRSPQAVGSSSESVLHDSPKWNS